MAVISKIRSYSGLLIAVIGFALAAFVLGDFLGYGPMRPQRADIGRVDRTQISYMEFDRRVNDQMDQWRSQTGVQQIGQRESFQIRQDVWNQMVREVLLDNELERLGIDISSQELYDMIHGPDPHPWIVSSFTNPVDGSYDPQQVINFLRNFDMLDPSTRMQWIQLEQFIKRERQENKYHNLLRRGFYVPHALAKRDFQDRNTTADLRFVFMPFASIDDTLVSVSERELRRVYDENKHRFEREATRSLEYVAFPVFPTEEDREAIRREIQELKEELETTENVEAFINAVSDTRFNPAFMARGDLSPLIEEVMFDSQVGTIYGPYTEDNRFVLAKLTDVQMRPDSMRASHILIAYTGSRAAYPELVRSREQAEAKADSILNVVRRNPARFGALAEEFSDDPSAAMNQGDLEWFRDGEMVPEFNEAVIEANVGTFTTVESIFGFHVIHITGKSPATRKVQVAKLTRDIEPSSRTYQQVFGNASEFASLLRQTRDFGEAVAEKGLSKRVVEEIREMDNAIPGIENPREIIRWAFDERTREGSFSRIFDIEGRFIIATVTQKTDAGIPDLDDIRDDIMAIAIRQKKFEKMAEQMRQAMAQGNLDAIAGELQMQVREANDVRFTMVNLPGVGAEPKVIGAIFGLEPNTISQPIKGNTGVFLAEITRMDEAVTPENLEPTKQQWRNTFSNRVQNDVFQALKNNARIEDNRSDFY
jgi:peptidyl-prolyl cis-trans isomerase D